MKFVVNYNGESAVRDSIIKQGLFGLFVCVFFVLSIGVSSYSEMSRVLSGEQDVHSENMNQQPVAPGISQFQDGILVNTTLYHLAATRDGMSLKPQGHDSFWGLRFQETNSIFPRVDSDPMLVGMDRMLIPHASLVEDVRFDMSGFNHQLVIPSVPVDNRDGVFIIEGSILSTAKTNVNKQGDWEWDLDSMKLSLSPYRVQDAGGNELPATVSLEEDIIHIVIPSSALKSAEYPVKIY